MRPSLANHLAGYGPSHEAEEDGGHDESHVQRLENRSLVDAPLARVSGARSRRGVEHEHEISCRQHDVQCSEHADPEDDDVTCFSRGDLLRGPQLGEGNSAGADLAGDTSENCEHFCFTS